jgi:transcriptional antiterminator NusG
MTSGLKTPNLLCTVHALSCAEVNCLPVGERLTTDMRGRGSCGGIGRSADMLPQTEGGEALAEHAWYAVWTKSHCERLVLDQLSAKGFTAFLPEVGMWSKRLGKMHVVPVPMFPGYLFVRDEMSKHAYVEMLKVRGLVRILENGWSRLTPVPNGEVESVERVVQSKVPVFQHALHEGDRVRVKEGPLAGAEGVFIQDKPGSGRLIVSVGLLGRGIAVEVDCTSVTPCSHSSAN